MSLILSAIRLVIKPNLCKWQITNEEKTDYHVLKKLWINGSQKINAIF